jgi:hypothetical protein
MILSKQEAKNQFLAIFSKNKHFKAYVASEFSYKYCHCEYFGESEPSSLKIRNLGHPQKEQAHLAMFLTKIEENEP